VKTCALVLSVGALVAAGCGGDNDTTTTVAAVPQSMALTVYKLRGGLLRPHVVHVPRTRAVAAAALRSLGFDTSVTVSNGTARVALPKLADSHVAEIVFTLTQFPTVARVDVAGRTGLTRDDFAGYVPPILVDSPPPGAHVHRTFHVAGSASVFEATLVVQTIRNGKPIERKTVTASEGAPGRGTFDATMHATPGRLTVRAFSPSAVDGSPQHEVDVDVEVTP
jgi:Immunoglobulin-like domain of bacterial spore germination